jgi:hypothetical protein
MHVLMTGRSANIRQNFSDCPLLMLGCTRVYIPLVGLQLLLTDEACVQSYEWGFFA